MCLFQWFGDMFQVSPRNALPFFDQRLLKSAFFRVVEVKGAPSREDFNNTKMHYLDVFHLLVIPKFKKNIDYAKSYGPALGTTDCGGRWPLKATNSQGKRSIRTVKITSIGWHDKKY